MDKMYSALQQNKRNIWSQYFPHCLPSPRSPSLFTLNLLHSHTIPCLSLPPGSPTFSFGCQQREKWFPVYTEDSQKRKWEQCPFHKQYTPSISSCHLRSVVHGAAIFQAATSGATVLKIGVRWSPAITVYENRVRVFTILIPGLCEPLAHHSCCGS